MFEHEINKLLNDTIKYKSEFVTQNYKCDKLWQNIIVKQSTHSGISFQDQFLSSSYNEMASSPYKFWSGNVTHVHIRGTLYMTVRFVPYAISLVNSQESFSPPFTGIHSNY